MDRSLILLKFVYFFHQSGFACFLLYATLYCYHLGLTPSQVGLVWGLEPLVQFFFAPLWGSVSDKYSKHKQIFMTSLVCTAGLYLALLFIPAVNQVQTTTEYVAGNCSAGLGIGVSEADLECLIPESDLGKVAFSLGSEIDYEFCSTICNSELTDTLNGPYVCDINSNIIPCDVCVGNSQDAAVIKGYSQSSNDTLIVPSYLTLTCKESGSRTTIDTFVNTTGLSPESCDQLKCCQCQAFQGIEGEDPGNLTLTFGLCTFLVLVASVFSSIQMPFMDAVCFGLLRDKPEDYGKQRLWGSIGWGIFALVAGFAVDLYNMKIASDRTYYDPIFYMYISFMALTFISTYFLRFPKHKSAKRMKQNMCQLVKKVHIMAFFGIVTVMGICFGTQTGFLFLFMDELNSTYLIMGLSHTVTNIVETPCFFVSGKIIKRFGHNAVFCISLVAISVKFLGYSFAPNPWVVLPFQVLQGMVFGLFWAAATSYASIIAPRGMVATLQTCVSGLHFGVGKAIGTALGGIVYEKFGSRILFRVVAVLCLAALLMYYSVLCYYKLTGNPLDTQRARDIHGENGEPFRRKGEDIQEANSPLQEKMTGTEVNSHPNSDMHEQVDV